MPKLQKAAHKSAPPNETKRQKFLKVRCTSREYEEVRQRAGQAGLTVSDYLRHAAFSQRIVARNAGAVIGELRRIGALIKHNYPSVQNWSVSEKRRYWQSHEQLWKLADQVALHLGLKKPQKTARS